MNLWRRQRQPAPAPPAPEPRPEPPRQTPPRETVRRRRVRPPSLGLTLRADPATLAQFTRLASVLGVSRSRLATAAVVDGVEALLEQPEVQAMLSGAPPCRSARGGEARRPSGTASDEAERHQSSATSPGVSIHPPSRVPRGEVVSVSAASPPAQSVGVTVAEPKPKKARTWVHNAIKRRRVQRHRGRPDTSSPLTLVSAELFDCAPLRARLTERACGANKKRARGDLYLSECMACPGVKTLAEAGG